MRGGPLVRAPAVYLCSLLLHCGSSLQHTHAAHRARCGRTLFGARTSHAADGRCKFRRTKVGEEASHPPQHACSSLHHTCPRGLAHRATPASESTARATTGRSRCCARRHSHTSQAENVGWSLSLQEWPFGQDPRCPGCVFHYSPHYPARAARSRSRPHTWLLLLAACEPMWPAPAVHCRWHIVPTTPEM